LWDLRAVNPATQPVTFGKFEEAAALTFSPDSHWLAIRSYSGIKLIDMEEPDINQALLLKGNIESSGELIFSPDGKTLISGNQSSVALWHFSWEDLASLACQAVGRNLTQLEWQQYFPDEPYRITCPQWPAGE
jgi:WD40 repeat protein